MTASWELPTISEQITGERGVHGGLTNTAHEEAMGHLRTSPALPLTVALTALWLMEMSGATCSLAGRNESKVTSSAVLPDSSLGSPDCPGLLAVSPQETARSSPSRVWKEERKAGSGRVFPQSPTVPKGSSSTGSNAGQKFGVPRSGPWGTRAAVGLLCPASHAVCFVFNILCFLKSAICQLH